MRCSSVIACQHICNTVFYMTRMCYLSLHRDAAVCFSFLFFLGYHCQHRVTWWVIWFMTILTNYKIDKLVGNCPFKAGCLSSCGIAPISLWNSRTMNFLLTFISQKLTYWRWLMLSKIPCSFGGKEKTSFPFTAASSGSGLFLQWCTPSNVFCFVDNFTWVVREKCHETFREKYNSVSMHEGANYRYMLYIGLGWKGVNFRNSLTAFGVCYIGSKDKDVVKYFWKKFVFTYA